ncbi:hypothetical protein [Ethanoligenens sp.]|uniref:hypothetical protein n=1 Tax=Ethanoligenens sp. TaxID=2099655 RepID=UPI0039ECEF08
MATPAKSEIQLLNNECCLVFDFGCYFPYSNFEMLTFNFSLGLEEFDDYKINHRYPNKNYHTISKKYGRKLSKIGYPYIMKLDEQSPMLLCLKAGINKQYITMIFPVQTNMTKDRPVSGLSLRYDFDKSEFHFTSYKKSVNRGAYHPHIWRNHEIEGDRKGNNDILLNPPCKVGGGSCTLLYDNVIEPCSTTLSDLLL